jgi:hypothetical protein
VASYTLQPNEVLLLKEERVAHGGTFSSFTDELILTSVNLVLVKKGMLGNTKRVLTFPLNQIKVHDRQAQALAGQSSNGSSVLEVYFLSGQEEFRFSSGRKKVLAWVAKVNQAVTGQESSPGAGDTGPALPGAEHVLGALQGTFNVLKGTFGSKPPVGAPVVVAGKCTACGAPISGVSGVVATCGYCGTAQHA